MIFGIVGVMEIDVVAEELTAYWMVAELVMQLAERVGFEAGVRRGLKRPPMNFECGAFPIGALSPWSIGLPS
jgi:hypothetical protein